MDEEDTLISDLEETLIDDPRPTEPLSLCTLRSLQTFLDKLPPHGPAADRFLSAHSSSLLLPRLASSMDSGPAPLSLLSSNAYLSLLLLSPSCVSNFSPLPFLSLLSSLRRSLKQRPGTAHMEQGEQSGCAVRRKNTRKGKSISPSPSSSSAGMDIGIYFCVLEKLEQALGVVKLNRFPDVLRPLIQTMVEIPASAGEVFGNLSEFNRLTGLCSEVLVKVLGSEEEGEVAETAAEVLKLLTPLILTSSKSQARGFALGFVKGLMNGNAVGEREGVKKAVVNFPRYLAKKAPEKAEARGLAVEAIMEVVMGMEVQAKVEFAEFALRTTCGKGNLRILGVDLVFNLLAVGGRELLGAKICKGCLDALIERCSDLNAGVRARALLNLTQLVGVLSGDEEKYFVVLKQVVGDVARSRCLDEKANVRRAALGLVTKLIGVLGWEILDGGSLIKTIGMACLDPLVSIRKAAVSAISEAFRTFLEESVIVEWLHSVPRLINDNESSIQEECENLFLELVLDRVCNAGSSATLHTEPIFSGSNEKGKSAEKEINHLFPGKVLDLLRELCDGEVAPWVKKICRGLGKKRKLKPKIATALQNIIKASESQWLSDSMPIANWTAPSGAWFLLSELSAYLPKSVDWEFLRHHWELLDKSRVAEDFNEHCQCPHEIEEGIDSESFAWAGDRVFLLQTISNVAVELPPEAAADLAHNLLKRIEKFNMHTTEVNAHVKALRTLCKRKASNPDEADTLVRKWVQQVLSKASGILEKYISSSSKASNENTFFTPPKTGAQQGTRARAGFRSLSQAEIAVYTIGSVIIICPLADTSAVIPLLHTIITSGHSNSKLSIARPAMPLKQTAPSLYVQAWLTMGKLCLSDDKLAKKYIPLFVQELEKSDSASLRNNLVVIMSDFCVRYTALVDCYISKITKCLRDPCELVRRQTFILLSRLLQRDYVKWRGVLFLRFLLSLVDESEKVRQLADFLFGNILKVKAPLLAYNSFVEAIFALNDCNVHAGNSGTKDSKAETRLFSIRGVDENSRSRRMHIYVSLLKQMAPEHLLATFAKLCAEILAAASDGMLNIDDITGQSVLQDAFRVLSCKEMRLQAGRGSQADAGDVEEDGRDGGASATATAKGRAITQAVRKGLIQNTIPIFIELKRLLESKNSPLIGSLMECLRVLLKDFKNEIDDILVADQQLRKELIYDMEKYETAKARMAAAAASVQRQSSFLSPKATMAASGAPPPQSKLAAKLQGDARVASAMADAAAAARARSVLKEINKGAATPLLSSISMPKLKSTNGGPGAQTDRHSEVIESLRRRQSFDSDDDN